jgi:hypothetical protein
MLYALDRIAKPVASGTTETTKTTSRQPGEARTIQVPIVDYNEHHRDVHSRTRIGKDQCAVAIGSGRVILFSVFALVVTEMGYRPVVADIDGQWTHVDRIDREHDPSHSQCQIPSIKSTFFEKNPKETVHNHKYKINIFKKNPKETVHNHKQRAATWTRIGTNQY